MGHEGSGPLVNPRGLIGSPGRDSLELWQVVNGVSSGGGCVVEGGGREGSLNRAKLRRHKKQPYDDYCNCCGIIRTVHRRPSASLCPSPLALEALHRTKTFHTIQLDAKQGSK